MSSEYRPGDLILVQIPFTDLTGTKKRPALVLLARDGDYLVAFITSRLDQATPGDVVLRHSKANGLAVDSAVLVQKLFTVHGSLIARRLGRCSPASHRKVVEELSARLVKNL
jgi:mRNA interferase MazF